MFFKNLPFPPTFSNAMLQNAHNNLLWKPGYGHCVLNSMQRMKMPFVCNDGGEAKEITQVQNQNRRSATVYFAISLGKGQGQQHLITIHSFLSSPSLPASFTINLVPFHATSKYHPVHISAAAFLRFPSLDLHPNSPAFLLLLYVLSFVSKRRGNDS